MDPNTTAPAAADNADPTPVPAIDDRWLDAAAQRRREILGLNQRLTELAQETANKTRQLANSTQALDQIKIAIVAGTPFPEAQQGQTPAVK